MRRERRGLALALALGLAGCGGGGAPAIRIGAPCATCGMALAPSGFACERRAARGWKQYDAIECLLADPGTSAPTATWLADYDTRGLHRADSMWVVRGAFPSPMGGGYAAFFTRRAADEIAAQTAGRVDRLTGFDAGEDGR